MALSLASKVFCIYIFDQLVGFAKNHYSSRPHGLWVNSLDSEPILARGRIVNLGGEGGLLTSFPWRGGGGGLNRGFTNRILARFLEGILALVRILALRFSFFYIIDLAKLYYIVERLPRFNSVNGPLLLDWDQAPRGSVGKSEKKHRQAKRPILRCSACFARLVFVLSFVLICLFVCFAVPLRFLPFSPTAKCQATLISINTPESGYPIWPVVIRN